jgi:hypothetical protein
MGIGLVIQTTVNAKELNSNKVARPTFYGSSISFPTKNIPRNTTLSINGPNGFHASKFSVSGMPAVDLYKNGGMKDGLYHYEITTAVGKSVLIKDTMNNGRGENNSHYARKGVTQSGHFRVVNGQIKNNRNSEEPTESRNY